MTITGTPNLGADGKDHRANFVHAPFSEKSVRQAPLAGAWFGGCQPVTSLAM